MATSSSSRKRRSDSLKARITRLEERLAQSDERQAQCEGRLAKLEAQVALGAPYPTYPDTLPQVSDPNVCRVCGMRFEGSMGYVCPRVDCPSGFSYCESKNVNATPVAP